MLLEDLEKSLSYFFSNKMLLIQALTHRSYGRANYERLEFLGDGILNAIITIELFDYFPQLKEGKLSRLRAELVREKTLVKVAEHLFLYQFIRMGEGEIKSGGRHRASILADVCEALIGAIFLDGGMISVYKVIKKIFSPLFIEFNNHLDYKDAKTTLQEFCQSRQFSLPIYQIIFSQGADHEQYFKVSCCLSDLTLKSYGEGKNRRSAEQQAAQTMIEMIQAN